MPLPTPFPYIICIDFNSPEADYTPLMSELSSSYAWWHYLKNTWIVLRYEALVELGPKIDSLVFPSDRVLILPAYGPAHGFLPAEAWTWINERLPRAW